MDILLLSDADLTANTPLGGNIDPDKYRFCVLDAQRSKLEEILGEDLYNKIKTDFDADTLAGDYETLYTKYIKPFLIHQSAMEYLLIGAYTIANGGISKHTPSNGQPIEKNEVDYMVQNQRSKAEMWQQRMEKWLSVNPLDEYNSDSDTIVPPNKASGFGNWYLGD